MKTRLWLLLLLPLVGGCRGGEALQLGNGGQPPVEVLALEAQDFWRLKSPGGERFDASGLLLHKGRLWVINDREPLIYEVSLANEHLGTLRPTELLSLPEVTPGPNKAYDLEGIASDADGIIYVSEESRRIIYRNGKALAIDWSPVEKYFRGGPNASFEGVAVGGGKLWVANERSDPRIIVVDLTTLAVEDSFYVPATGFAFGGSHYSDLCWFEGFLYVLDRNHRVILKVNPATQKAVAEYRFGQMEIQEEFAYQNDYPTGTMEGLAVDAKHFWLITDNNGKGRFANSQDTRPTLFRCEIPIDR